MQHDDLLTCRRLLQGGSRSFYAASLVLPRTMRDAATALYAFCRLADDAIDGGDDPARELTVLNARLDRVYSDQPIDHAADRAFASIVARHDIPRALPQALLEGFAWDAVGKRYETLEELCGYAARVAGTVGVMMTLLMGRRDAAVLARASDLGVAMQLTNIARDVGEDARAGRLYLPLRWLREAGIDPDAFMARPRFTPALASVVQRLLAVADGLYARSSAGVAHLPLRCRPGMHAARVLYAEIGNEVGRRGHDSVAQRAVVPASGKMRALAEAALSCFALPRDLLQPGLRETQFLIDAVIASPARIAAETYPAWWDIGARALRLIDLFERLERREQTRRA